MLICYENSQRCPKLQVIANREGCPGEEMEIPNLFVAFKEKTMMNYCTSKNLY